MERRFRFVPKDEIKNIPIQEYLNRIKEKYFVDKSMDFLLGFWFTLRVVEQKIMGILVRSVDDFEETFVNNEGMVCLSARATAFFNEFMSAFKLFGKAVLELTIKIKVENRKVNGFISWFLYYFSGLNSPGREMKAFDRLMHSNIPTILVKNGAGSIEQEMTQKEIIAIKSVLSKEPTDFLRGMQCCFKFIDNFLLVLPANIRHYILSRRHLNIDLAVLKEIIDNILLRRAKRKFNIIDQTLVANIGMIEFLRSSYRIHVLKGDYENTISD